MTPSSPGPLKLDHEAPARQEFMIALVTIFAIVVSFFACELVTPVQDNNTETQSTYSRLRTHNV